MASIFYFRSLRHNTLEKGDGFDHLFFRESLVKFIYNDLPIGDLYDKIYILMCILH